jgi:hypothetical protein
MPHFSSVLTEEQINQIIEYERNLSTETTAP